MNQYLVGFLIVVAFLMTSGLVFYVGRRTCPQCSSTTYPQNNSNNSQPSKCPETDCSKCPINEPANSAITCSNGICGANTSSGVVLNKSGTGYIPCGDNGIYSITNGTCNRIENVHYIPFLPPIFVKDPAPLEEVNLGSPIIAKNRIGWTLNYNLPTTYDLIIEFTAPQTLFIIYPGTGKNEELSYLSKGTIQTNIFTDSIVSSFIPWYNGITFSVVVSDRLVREAVTLLSTQISVSSPTKTYMQISDSNGGGPISQTSMQLTASYLDYSILAKSM